MASCVYGCGSLTDYPERGCTESLLVGGISYLFVKECGYEFDESSAGEWNTAISNGKVRVVGPVLGSKSEASFTTRKIDSCNPERVGAAVRSVTFQDHNPNINVDAFYNDLLSQAQNFDFGYMDCNDRFYGWTSFSFQGSRVHDDSAQDGASYVSGSVSYTGITDLEPIDMPVGVTGLT